MRNVQRHFVVDHGAANHILGHHVQAVFARRKRNRLLIEGSALDCFTQKFGWNFHGDYVFKNPNPRLGFASPRMASIAQ